jgi:hypothetical protein
VHVGGNTTQLLITQTDPAVHFKHEKYMPSKPYTCENLPGRGFPSSACGRPRTLVVAVKISSSEASGSSSLTRLKAAWCRCRAMLHPPVLDLGVEQGAVLGHQLVAEEKQHEVAIAALAGQACTRHPPSEGRDGFHLGRLYTVHCPSFAELTFPRSFVENSSLICS